MKGTSGSTKALIGSLISAKTIFARKENGIRTLRCSAFFSGASTTSGLVTINGGNVRSNSVELGSLVGFSSLLGLLMDCLLLFRSLGLTISFSSSSCCGSRSSSCSTAKSLSVFVVAAAAFTISANDASSGPASTSPIVPCT